MKELGRLLHYSRPYTPHLIVSVVLMACVGAAQALTALLIGPDFRSRAQSRVGGRAGAALHHPHLQARRSIWTPSCRPSIHNVWTMVAVSILAVFRDQRPVRLLRAIT